MTRSCSLTLQINLIIALSCRCRCWRFGFVKSQVSLAWSIALLTQELYTRPRVLKERWREERTGSNSLNFFQAVFTRVHSHQLLRACLLGSKMKLPPPACQVRLGLPSVVCHPRGMQFPGTMYICNQGLCRALEPTAFHVHPVLAAIAEDAVAAQCDRMAHGNLPELCKRSRPVPQIMILVFPAFTLCPFSFILSPPLLLSKSRAS